MMEKISALQNCVLSVLVLCKSLVKTEGTSGGGAHDLGHYGAVACPSPAHSVSLLGASLSSVQPRARETGRWARQGCEL